MVQTFNHEVYHLSQTLAWADPSIGWEIFPSAANTFGTTIIDLVLKEAANDEEHDAENFAYTVLVELAKKGIYP